jgi:hypothetical protein
MAQHEVEITISKSGQVMVHVKGAKGKACLEYAKWLEDIVGKVADRQLTSEYYEQEEQTRTKLHQELRREQ